MITLLAAALCSWSGTPTDVKDSDRATLIFIRDTYRANRASLGFGTVRFREAVGRARASTEARSGSLSGGLEAGGVLIFDGRDVRFERAIADSELLGVASRIGDDQVRVPIRPVRMLTDGECALIEIKSPNPSLKATSTDQAIYAARSMYRDWFLPINLGWPAANRNDLATDIDEILKGNCTLIKLDTAASFEGRPAIHISLKAKNGTQEYWIDPERGAIPRYILGKVPEGNYTYHTYLDDVKSVAGDSWLPHKLTLFSEHNGTARRVSLATADLTTRPSRSEFKLGFERPVRLSDETKRAEYAARSEWDLHNLPSPSSADSRPFRADNGPRPPGMPGERTESWTMAYVLAATSGILLVLGILRMRRRSKP